jgi:hypothetical protein
VGDEVPSSPGTHTGWGGVLVIGGINVAQVRRDTGSEIEPRAAEFTLDRGYGGRPY